MVDRTRPKNRVRAIAADPPMHPTAFEAGKKLWVESLRAAGDEVSDEDHRDAALFVATGDLPAAEQILLAAAAKSSDTRAWSMQLGRLYFQVLVGSEGPLPLGVVRQVSRTNAKGTFAQQIRHKLDTTTDVDLLAAVAQGLVRQGDQLYSRQAIDFDPVELAGHYADRVRSLAPESSNCTVTRVRDRKRSHPTPHREFLAGLLEPRDQQSFAPAVHEGRFRGQYASGKNSNAQS